MGDLGGSVTSEPVEAVQRDGETSEPADGADDPAEAPREDPAAEAPPQDTATTTQHATDAETGAHEMDDMLDHVDDLPLDDMLDQVDDLPLDEELAEVLPTVLEEPENESKEQDASIEEEHSEGVAGDVEAAAAVGEDEAGHDNVEVVKTQAVDGVSENAGVSTALQHADVVQSEDGTAEGEAEVSGFADSETVAVIDADSNIAVPTEVQHINHPAEPAEPAEPTEQHETNEDGSVAQVQEDVCAAEQGEKSPSGEVGREASETGEETEKAEAAGDQPAPTTDTVTSQHENDTAPADRQTADGGDQDVSSTAETVEKKNASRTKKTKRKKKKKKKSADGSGAAAKESASFKPAMLHIEGGFSCGWVGPMFQLLGTMKKLDEFKVCYARKYGDDADIDGGGGGIIGKILNAEAQQNAERPSEAVAIPESLIRPADPDQGCPRCGGAVFQAECMKSRFRSYHKPCFNCSACHRTLDSTKACDGPDRDVYCKLCYSKKYGPKGYGFGGGAAFLQSDVISVQSPQSKPEWVSLDRKSIKPTEGPGCPRCGGAVFAAELMLSKGQEWHITCFSCHDCRRPLDSTIACDGPDKEVYCKNDYAKRFGPKGFGFGHAPTLVTFVSDDEVQRQAQKSCAMRRASEPNLGQRAAPGEGCPRCDFAVYAAEMLLHNNRAYHRQCFCCGECGRGLDSTNACSGPDGDLICRPCYGRQHGPKGVGYGQGAGVLSMG